MRIPKRVVLGLLLIIPAAAVGQTAPGAAPQPGQPVGPVPPGPIPRGSGPPGPAAPGPVPPEQIQPPGEATRLPSRTIVPPNVDPGMDKVPPADAGSSMPVIRPPGSSGTNSDVVPK